MTLSQSDLSDLLDALRACGDLDIVRKSVERHCDEIVVRRSALRFGEHFEQDPEHLSRSGTSRLVRVRVCTATLGARGASRAPSRVSVVFRPSPDRRAVEASDRARHQTKRKEVSHETSGSRQR